MCLTALAMAGMGAKAGGAALSISGTLKEGAEEKRQAYFMAEDEERNAVFEESMGLIKGKKMVEAAGEAAGQARAAVAKSGVTPSGSAGTTITKTRADILGDAALMGMETMAKSDAAKRKAKEWRRSGKEAVRKAKMAAWATGLGAGYEMTKFGVGGGLFG